MPNLSFLPPWHLLNSQLNNHSFWQICPYTLLRSAAQNKRWESTTNKPARSPIYSLTTSATNILLNQIKNTADCSFAFGLFVLGHGRKHLFNSCILPINQQKRLPPVVIFCMHWHLLVAINRTEVAVLKEGATPKQKSFICTVVFVVALNLC